MRKVSKSRADDDGISSANGSVKDDRSDTQQSDENDKQSDFEEDPISDDAEEKEKEETKKKGKSKSKGKNKKSDKEEPEEEYEVDKVIDSKKIKGKLHYLIRWKGYSADNDTWEPENTLSCPELISKYHDEKEDSSNKKKESASPKKGKKRGAKKEKSSPKKAKRTKNNEWDSENADEKAEYEVDRILEVHHGKNGKREFLIHWKGWSNKFDSWEPESNLNCSDLIAKFMEKVEAAKSTDARNLRVAPGTTNRFTLQAPSSGRRLSKRRGQKQRVRYDDAE